MAIQIRPNFAKAYYDRGKAWAKKRQNAKAIADYTKAVELNPKYTYAYGSRANTWRRMGQYEKAIADYTKVIELKPSQKGLAFSYLYRGRCWLQKSLYGNALADMLKSVEVNPKYAKAHNSIAWLYATCPEERFRDGKKAVKHAQMAFSIKKKMVRGRHFGCGVC